MHWKTLDLATGRQLSEINLDLSENGAVHFHPDGRGVVKTVLRNEERTLFYQPIDGSAPHTLIDPVQESIYDFGWSPSGKQLAVLKGRYRSDVVMITDQAGKWKD